MYLCNYYLLFFARGFAHIQQKVSYVTNTLILLIKMKVTNTKNMCTKFDDDRLKCNK